MINLKTNYMGLALDTPIILGANNMVTDIEKIKKAEESGVSAVVFKSLFEEQIQLESLQLDEDLHEYDHRSAEMEKLFPEIEHAGPEEHLRAIRKLKESISIPVIASLNAIYNPTWVEYAQLLEQTGVDAIEMNFYRVPISSDADAKMIEDHQLNVFKEVRKAVKIPIGVKLSPFYSNPLNFISKLDKAGANSIVMFNRFFQPDINLETEEFYFPWEFTKQGDYQLTLRYIGLLYGNVKASLIANRGIRTGEDILKMILAGADAVQLVSTFYENGIEHSIDLLKSMSNWMDKKGYASLDEFRGKLSKGKLNDEFAYKRAQYIDILKNSAEIMKKYPMR